MKLDPVTKLDKRNKTTLCRQVLIPLSFLRFMAKLEQSGSWNSDVQSEKDKFLSTVTFYLTKTENITKKSLTHVSKYCFE